jgi:hypothetical protein
MVRFEAGLELELEIHQVRDLILHSEYGPDFILLGTKNLGASPPHSRLLLSWAKHHPHSSPFRSSSPVGRDPPHSPVLALHLSCVTLSPFPLSQLKTSPEVPPFKPWVTLVSAKVSITFL